MATLRDIMTTRLVTVAPSATLREVADTLSAEGISGVPVVAGERVVGVISAMDLIDFGSSGAAAPAGSEPDFDEVDGDPGSFFSEWWPDAATSEMIGFGEQHAGSEWEALEAHTAEELMTRRLCTLPPDTDLREAARYMVRNGVHRVLVVEGERLAGLATTMDFLRALAEGKI